MTVPAMTVLARVRRACFTVVDVVRCAIDFCIAARDLSRERSPRMVHGRGHSAEHADDHR